MICIWSVWYPCQLISCFIKIQIGLTFLVVAYPDCPGKETVKWVSSAALNKISSRLSNRLSVTVEVCVIHIVTAFSEFTELLTIC